MSGSTETNPQPTPSNPEPVDWATPDADEVRLPAPKPSAPEPEEQPDPDNAALEGDDEQPPPQKDAAGEDDDPIGDDPEEGDDTPDFWAKEDKEFWKQVPPELKPILKKYEQQRIEFANQKAQEAAVERKKAADEAQKAIGVNAQYAKWWEDNGPAFTRAFVDRWSGVDFDQLAVDNPAEWARLSQMRAKEHQMLSQANSQAEASRTEAANQAKKAHQEARVAEHGKLAAKFPKEFGTPEAADKTYKVLSGYLAKYGFSPERIGNTYEAPIVEIVRKAYKYDQLQAKAKGITDLKPPAQSASTTPTRVVPGARSSANPANEATRQAEERLRSGQRLSPEEAALAFR